MPTKLPCPVCLNENRDPDGFDLIAIMGLMKEYNRPEIWRRYLPRDAPHDNVSMYVEARNYFIEMHVQKMDRIILSEKFNTNPFFMQQAIQRMAAGHDHDLIMTKIRRQGIDTGDKPISLSCSLGNTIIDLIAQKAEPFPEKRTSARGNTPIEDSEDRPIDVYDLSSALYLCQQNLTDVVFRRYSRENPTADSEVSMSPVVGDYRIDLRFRCVSTDREHLISPPGNASVFTMNQVIQRMNFRHAEELILKEMIDVGLSIGIDQVRTGFTLVRLINNTSLTINFEKVA